MDRARYQFGALQLYQMALLGVVALQDEYAKDLHMDSSEDKMHKVGDAAARRTALCPW